MIAWLTTVAPSTTASSSSSSSSSYSEEYGGANPDFDSSRSQSGSTSASASWNWSQTNSNSGITDSFSAGTTWTERNFSGQITNIDIQVDGNYFATATPTTLNLTNSRYVQTSTTVSDSYFFQETILSENNGTQWTSVEIVSGTNSSTFFVETNANILNLELGEQQSVSSESTTTTTINQTELDPNYYATIYQTGGNPASPNNEIIWFLDTYSDQIFNGSYSAASAKASSGTRFTARPWSKTSEAGVVASTDGVSFAGRTIKNVFSIKTSSTTQDYKTIAEGSVAIGLTTRKESCENHTTTDTTLSFTFAEFSDYTKAASTSQKDFWFVGLQKTTAYADIVSGGVENTYEALWVSLESATYRTSLQVVTTTSASGNVGLTQSEMGIYRSSQVYQIPPMGVTTVSQIDRFDQFGGGWNPTFNISPQPTNPIIQPEIYAATYTPIGVVGKDGNIALYYNSPVTIDVVQEDGIKTYVPQLSETILRLYASHCRGIATLVPSTYSFYNNNNEQSGIMSVDGLSISATSINTSQTDESGTTTSFELTASEQAGTVLGVVGGGTDGNPTTFFPYQWIYHGGELGNYESAFFTIRAGVYKIEDQSYSTTGEIRSWNGSRETSIIRPVSFLIPIFQTVAPVAWTATRNHTAFNQDGSPEPY